MTVKKAEEKDYPVASDKGHKNGMVLDLVTK
jgi:hypothetical protein